MGNNISKYFWDDDGDGDEGGQQKYNALEQKVHEKIKKKKNWNVGQDM